MRLASLCCLWLLLGAFRPHYRPEAKLAASWRALPYPNLPYSTWSGHVDALQVRRAVGDMVDEMDSKRKKSLALLQRGLAIDSETPLIKRASRSSRVSCGPRDAVLAGQA